MNSQMTKCHIYDLYLTSCMTAASSKLDICGWSSELECEKECPNNLIWNDCASTNEIQLCGNGGSSIAPSSSSLAPSNLLGMCVCKDGLFLDGDNCVESKSECKNCEIEPGVWVPNGYRQGSTNHRPILIDLVCESFKKENNRRTATWNVDVTMENFLVSHLSVTLRLRSVIKTQAGFFGPIQALIRTFWKTPPEIQFSRARHRLRSGKLIHFFEISIFCKKDYLMN